MPVKINKVGILTSGGDAPGMNAAVRAATRAALANGVKVAGIYKGYRGLMDDEMRELSARDVSNIIASGGTVLYSDRCDEFKTEEGQRKAVEICRKNGIDGIIAIGGDGTFRGALELSKRGVSVMGIPGTIDNDITATEYSIGFDTAMNTVLDMVDRLRDTCESHGRCNVVEVMGRNAGHIALECGIAVGAVGIAIREIPFDEAKCLEKIITCRRNGKRNFLIIISEGMGKDYADSISQKIESETGIVTRLARLAHVQRGGSPTLRDRFIASSMGVKAIELLLSGKSNQIVCMNDGQIGTVDIEYAFLLDKLYKETITEKELAGLSVGDKAQMLEIVRKRKDYIRTLYEMADMISH